MSTRRTHERTNRIRPGERSHAASDGTRCAANRLLTVLPSLWRVRSVGGRGVRFEPPVAWRTNVTRPRLISRLQDRFTTPVTVVVAPAGLGKTTLLAQAVAENRFAPRGVDCWLTCTADDAAGSSLGEGLCRALGISPPESVERATQVVIDAMWHRSPDELALVLDDVHEIPTASRGAEVLARLVAALPRNGHVVLSGRQPPPIVLSRLEVQGQVLRLAERDLLLTDDELAELAAQRCVLVEQLSKSGGWPALAELAASALPGVEAAYLWEEVLAGLEPDRRRDLALLAHIGVFDDELATAVLGHESDIASLTADLPLVATTSEDGRQIHALWRPYLAKAVSDAEIAEARRRAGVELAKSGDAAAAVRLLTDAGAWDDVTSVVADVLAAPGPPVPADVVAAWLDRLPANMTEGPLARLFGAVAAVQTDPVAATQDLEKAADAFRREGNPDGELACVAQLGRLAWWFEQPERLAGLAARLFEMEALGHDKAVPLACLGRALIADVMADSEAVLAELDRIPAGSLSETWQSVVDWLRSTSLNHLGRPAEAFEAATRACANANPLYAPVAESARLQALWFLGDVDEVLHELPPLVERTAATGLRDFTAFMAAISCLGFALVGQPEEAARYLERARGSAASPDSPLLDVNLVSADAALAVASGDEARATRVLHEYIERSPPFGTGLAAFAQRRTLPLWYVLVPESRHMWDSATLGPCFTVTRDFATALVAIRTSGRLPAGSPPLPAPNVARGLLPLPWATELALAHIAAGRKTGWTLLDALWPQAQSEVRRHAADPSAPLGRTARTALARLPVPPASHLELKLLGPVELRRDGTLVDAPEWRRERVRSLLAHLVLHRPVSRERLGADLWPTLDGDAQSRNLRVNLAHLLRVLEPERAERDASFLVRPHGGELILHQCEWFHTDIWLFDALWQRATEADDQGVPSLALDAMQQAVALWRGDSSELANDDWALPEVEERRRRVVGLAARAGELLLARGEPDAARRMGDLALRVDPWSERSHRVVVAAHLAADDHRAARRALEQYRSALEELNMAPTDITHKLEQLGSVAMPTR
jgi:LuxR family maltose regulon positive regulatory protein